MKTAYKITLGTFYISLLFVFYREPVAMLLNGYDLKIAFHNYDSTYNTVVKGYYSAFKESAYLMTIIVRTSLAIWVLTFIFSIYAIKNKHISLPYKIEKISLTISTIIVFLSIIVSIIRVPSGVVL